MKKPARLLALSLPAAAVAGGAGYMCARLKASMPRTRGKLAIPCLDDEVEVIYDGAGIPHITAASEMDGYRAVGFVMAQDRMVQMQTMLRVAKGNLSEAVGSMALDMDRFMRTVGLARAGEATAQNVSGESRECLEGFCQGVNAFLGRRSLRLPFEFMFMGGRPDPWTPGDCLTLGLFTTWLLDSFWLADLMREKLIRSLGMERAYELLPETAAYNNPPVKVDGPGHGAVTLPPGEEIDWDFTGEGGGGEWLLRGAPKTVYGSNNWAISGSRTVTGKPILCGDPHIQHNAPGTIYLMHVTTPAADIIGGAFPGLPIVAFGHNGYCGWTCTSLCPDTQDLYVETFESERSDRYLYKGEWLEPEVLEEPIKVRFGKDRKVKVVITRHGPIIKRKGDKGLALRWVSYDSTLDSLSAILEQNRARSWEQFTGAMRNFVGPAMSQAYADVDGNIGYMAAVKVPRRSNGDGAIPYDGSSGDGEWEGYVPFEDMPRALNPEEGFLATANSKIVSEGYPELITKAWESPYRNGRISELLRSREKWSVADMPYIHADTLTHPGRTFAQAAVAAARGVELSPAVAEAVERMSQWDYKARSDSVAMCIYFYAWEALRERLLRHRLGSALFEEYVSSWTTPNLAVEQVLAARDPYWLPPGCPSFESAVLDSIEEALVGLECLFGTADQSGWQWGRVHYLTCQSLLGLFWPLDKIFNVGPIPRDGEGDTVNASPPSSDCLTQLLARGTMGGCTDMAVLPDCNSHAAYAGPVLRMIMDFNDLDNSRAVLDVGQSGHRLSPHYKDHFPVWSAVEYFPLPYSREKVLEQMASRLTLRPGR